MTMSCRPSGQECAEVMAEPALQVSTFWFCCNTMWRHPTNQNQTCVREAQVQISWYSNLSLVLVLVLIQHVVTVTSSVHSEFIVFQSQQSRARLFFTPLMWRRLLIVLYWFYSLIHFYLYFFSLSVSVILSVLSLYSFDLFRVKGCHSCWLSNIVFIVSSFCLTVEALCHPDSDPFVSGFFRGCFWIKC